METVMEIMYEWKECILIVVVGAMLHWQGQGTESTLMECKGEATESLEEEMSRNEELKEELSIYRADRKLLESLQVQISNHLDHLEKSEK